MHTEYSELMVYVWGIPQFVVYYVQANIKKGFFSGSTLEKSLKKATDTWLPGDCKYTAV